MLKQIICSLFPDAERDITDTSFKGENVLRDEKGRQGVSISSKVWTGVRCLQELTALVADGKSML